MAVFDNLAEQWSLNMGNSLVCEVKGKLGLESLVVPLTENEAGEEEAMNNLASIDDTQKDLFQRKRNTKECKSLKL